MLRGSNVLRNLSVAGALTASFQNLDDTILIESDSYARSETYTQLETGAAITAAIEALDLSQFQNEAEAQALIAAALVPYWNQTEVSTYVAGELANYATSSSVTSAISSVLTSYDDSSQVDSKIITALLDFYTRAEVDQAIADATSGAVDLSNYYTQAETQSYLANELLAFYPRTELDSQLTATFTQYWTSSRTQTEINDAIAGAGFLTQALADQRYFAVSANGSFESLVRTNVTPPQIKALLPRAPLAANTILSDTTLELTCDAYTKAESDGRYLSSSSFAPLDARYFARNPAVAEGNGLFHLVQDQFTPQFIRSLLFRPPLTGGAILGNGSVIEIEADCWSKAQSDGRYPLVATFNSLGSTVTSIDGRVTALENAPGVAPTADLTVNSLTATSFVQTPLLQSAAADLQIRNATTTLRAEDGTLLASFAAGSIGLEQDITVRSDRTLNATTADFAQFFVGSTAATGAFTSSSSITATQQIESDLRAQAPLLRCDPAASVLTVTGGTQGVLVDDTLRVNGVIAPEASACRGAAAASPAGADRRGAQRFRGHRGAQRRGHGRRVADPGQQRAERAGGAQGARRRRRADEHSLPVHELQHHQRPRQPGDRTEHWRQQQRGADLRLRLREPLGQGTQEERAGPLGEGAPGDLRCRGAPHVRPDRGGQGPNRLHRPGGAGHPSGREGLQDQEPGRQRTHDARLSEAQRGSWPGTSTSGTPGSSSR